MKLNAQTRELLRNNILIQYEASGRVGCPLPTIYLGVRIAGFKLDDEDIAEEVSYLLDKGLLASVEKTLSPENVRYRITAEGRDYLAKEGLA